MKPRSDESDNIHITFGQNKRLVFCSRRAGASEIVEKPALGEQNRLAGVDVFGLGVGAQRAAAEGHDPTPKILDRKHHSVKEKIARGPTALGFARQSGLDHILKRNIIGFEMGDQRGIGVGRVSDTKARADLSIQAAGLEIIPCRGAYRRAELLFKEKHRELHHLVKRFATGFALLLFRRESGKLHPGKIGELLDRFGKVQAFGLTQPFERIAACAAAEAVIGPPLILYFERRRLFLVKWAKPPKYAALALQLYTLSHQLNQIGPPQDFVQEGFVVCDSNPTPSRGRRAE